MIINSIFPTFYLTNVSYIYSNNLCLAILLSFVVAFTSLKCISTLINLFVIVLINKEILLSFLLNVLLFFIGPFLEWILSPCIIHIPIYVTPLEYKWMLEIEFEYIYSGPEDLFNDQKKAYVKAKQDPYHASLLVLEWVQRPSEFRLAISRVFSGILYLGLTLYFLYCLSTVLYSLYLILFWGLTNACLNYGLTSFNSPSNYSLVAMCFIFRVLLGSGKSLAKRENILQFNRGFRLKSIPPLKPVEAPNLRLGVIDIETIPINSRHVPYAIGFRLFNQHEESCMFYLWNYSHLPTEQASREMLREFLTLFLAKAKGYHIYAHNLGEFDGYLLLRDLFKVSGKLEILMDSSKSIISLSLPQHKITIRDSLRIFPKTSLKDLSKIFNVPMSKGALDHSKVTLNLLNDPLFRLELKEYLNRDLISLLDVMLSATKQIHERYEIDLSKVFSTPSLAIRIFRSKFLKEHIPTLARPVDSFVRKAYKGGATEVFFTRGFKLYYYDVNSLYPYAMKNLIPFNFLGIKKGREINLNEFFGFVYAKIHVPRTVATPVLPWLDPISGRTLYPRGVFTGHYFSEELKAVAKLGYKITPMVGYEFDSKSLFDEYVDYHYNLKATSEGAERYITKLLLNGLYGFFGRDQNTWTAEILPTEDARRKLFTHPAYEVFNLEDGYEFILADSNPSDTFLNALEISRSDLIGSTKPSGSNSTVLSNVAIAAAITSYARILIIPLKTDPKNRCFYSDTDSFFLQYPLDPSLIGGALGQFKDELKGEVINEAYFLGDKFYGYKTNTYEKVVAAGIPTTHNDKVPGGKTSIMTFNELIDVWNGNTLSFSRQGIVKKNTRISIIQLHFNYYSTY